MIFLLRERQRTILKIEQIFSTKLPGNFRDCLNILSQNVQLLFDLWSRSLVCLVFNAHLVIERLAELWSTGRFLYIFYGNHSARLLANIPRSTLVLFGCCAMDRTAISLTTMLLSPPPLLQWQYFPEEPGLSSPLSFSTRRALVYSILYSFWLRSEGFLGKHRLEGCR